MPQRGAPRCKRWDQISPGGKPGHEAHDALGYLRSNTFICALKVALTDSPCHAEAGS
jgi:hypothetical protein